MGLWTTVWISLLLATPTLTNDAGSISVILFGSADVNLTFFLEKKLTVYLASFPASILTCYVA